MSGPFPILSTMNYGNGKVVFFGICTFFQQQLYLYRNNGWKIGLNTVNWLSNKPVPASYNKAGLFPYKRRLIWDMKILYTLILGLLIFLGLIYIIRRDIFDENSYKINTIKKWKFYGLGIENILLSSSRFNYVRFPISIISY